MNSSEWLCLWYLRLNGYFTLPNFIAHGRRDPLTEVDVLGIRLPHSTEFEDDIKTLNIPPDRIDIVFAEAKRKEITDLNGPWGTPEKGALDYVLKRVGVVPAKDVATLATDLYAKRSSTTDSCDLRIVCFAETAHEDLLKQGVTFVPWTAVLAFIHARFASNQRLKNDVSAWDEFGQYLWQTLSGQAIPDVDAFFFNWERRGQ